MNVNLLWFLKRRNSYSPCESLNCHQMARTASPWWIEAMWECYDRQGRGWEPCWTSESRPPLWPSAGSSPSHGTMPCSGTGGTSRRIGQPSSGPTGSESNPAASYRAGDIGVTCSFAGQPFLAGTSSCSGSSRHWLCWAVGCSSCKCPSGAAEFPTATADETAVLQVSWCMEYCKEFFPENSEMVLRTFAYVSRVCYMNLSRRRSIEFRLIYFAGSYITSMYPRPSGSSSSMMREAYSSACSLSWDSLFAEALSMRSCNWATD